LLLLLLLLHVVSISGLPVKARRLILVSWLSDNTWRSS
jgi:hypothetical protein